MRKIERVMEDLFELAAVEGSVCRYYNKNNEYPSCANCPLGEDRLSMRSCHGTVLESFALRLQQAVYEERNGNE